MELTIDQVAAARRGEAVPIRLPETGGEFVLVPAHRYEELLEIRQDEEQQRQLAAFARQQAAKRLLADE